MVAPGIPGVASAAPGDLAWARTYGGPAGLDDAAAAIDVSPDGSTVFVTGRSDGEGTADPTTVAYNSASGVRLWTSRLDPPGPSVGTGIDLAVSPDSTRVFVTGWIGSAEKGAHPDFATVAYDAGSGAELWVRRFDGRYGLADEASRIELSPDGSTLFVTGQSQAASGPVDYLSVAYDAVTGAKLWTKRYDGPENSDDVANGVAVSPDGSEVFVTGMSVRGGLSDYATVAYDAASGTRLWTKRFDGSGHSFDAAYSIAVGSDGARAFVTGTSIGAGGYRYVTVAYDTNTGVKLWSRRYNGAGSRVDVAYATAVSPDASTVYVTGESQGASSFYDFATVAYDASTGDDLWVRRYNAQANDLDSAYAIAVSPDGSGVFVTGVSYGGSSYYDYATVGYDSITGTMLWTKRYNGPGFSYDAAYDIAVSPDGMLVFVTGESDSPTEGRDYATVAFHR